MQARINSAPVKNEAVRVAGSGVIVIVEESWLSPCL